MTLSKRAAIAPRSVDQTELMIQEPDVASFRQRKRQIDEGPFGHYGAAQYDRDSEAMPRRYKSAHKLQNEIICQALKRQKSSWPLVVDLGCGTGNDGIEILSKASNAIFVGVDYSTHMLARASEKFKQRGFDTKSVFIRRDFRWLTADELIASLETAGLPNRASCVVSALALHHYDLAEKRAVYKLAFDLLEPKGLVVLTDLYSSTMNCSELALAREIEDIRKVIRRLKTGCANSARTTISEKHYLVDNLPQPLNHELSLLTTIGFEKFDVVYRNGQLGLVVLQK